MVSKTGLAFKRAFDIVFSVIGLILLFPVFLIVAILIKMQSPGHVFYCGLRAGRGGKPFRICKFRTMVDNAQKSTGDTTALNDPRVTKIGGWLRKYKLDEIPQLWNVFKGEMSLVGPRPELLYYTQQYTSEERCILDVRPGITDLSSIEFHALDERVGDKDADKVFEEEVLPVKNRLRVQYVKERSFALDMKIILKTIGVIVGKCRSSRL